MTALIVALSSADVTVRAVAVALLGFLALVLVAGRVDWSQLRRGTHRPTPIYVRVDQRPSQLDRQPDFRRRAAAAGGLTGLAVLGGVAIAVGVSLVLALLIGSVTDLLR